MNVLVGQNYIKNKEFKKALLLFSDLEKSDTKTSSIFFYLGLVYFELNKFDKSIFYYKKYFYHCNCIKRFSFLLNYFFYLIV